MVTFSDVDAVSQDVVTPADIELLDLVQRQNFRYFWDAAHPVSGLALDRLGEPPQPTKDLVAVGGSGFGIMAIVVATERQWISRADAVERLRAMVDILDRAPCYHGVFPHFMDGRTGATIPFSRKDDGGDIVETSFLCAGLLCARQYFDGDTAAEIELRRRINVLWDGVEWNWHTRGGRNVLYWHWSPNNGWSLDHEIRGWNECLITYVLAASSRHHAIDPAVYHRGWAESRNFMNRRTYYGIELPLGVEYGGPLCFAHYSFLGLDPRGLRDRYADYWDQNVRHTLINREHCLRNPNKHKGYGPACWGLTVSDDPQGYLVHAPYSDRGVIAPTAALASLPYTPGFSVHALRHFFHDLGDRIWGDYGFTSAFSEGKNWYSRVYFALDQGPVIAMIENYRTGLLWRLFMSCPEVLEGLARLGFESPYLD
ncbi:glucoamylase family protein [Chelatococcus sp. SYSU_G07232]|uniref:Glucoamylase family protein n=1 Tax=Chelatococcus albus TaxID=3047466 RepID=A0ABT7ADJ2_9HYPH|nr:glucoamylase family protein [Chelatococcus sp. SYSU_G07232]MDJ1157072.1 glucoamylase family protein [Chelatococcus sp. SYSU_G07232]